MTTAAVEYKIRNGDTEWRFFGAELGHASSFRRGKQRWAEIWMFRTDADFYVVAGVGRSVVPGEVDRWWADVFRDPVSAVRRMYVRDHGGVSRLPMTNRECLLQACQHDRRLSEAYID